jgi:hypothetical protein
VTGSRSIAGYRTLLNQRFERYPFGFGQAVPNFLTIGGTGVANLFQRTQNRFCYLYVVACDRLLDNLN